MLWSLLPYVSSDNVFDVNHFAWIGLRGLVYHGSHITDPEWEMLWCCVHKLRSDILQATPETRSVLPSEAQLADSWNHLVNVGYLLLYESDQTFQSETRLHSEDRYIELLNDHVHAFALENQSRDEDTEVETSDSDAAYAVAHRVFIRSKESVQTETRQRQR